MLQQGSLQAGHLLAERQRASCWSRPSPVQKRLWLGEDVMPFRSASCCEETASDLHSSQDKCQDMLPVMDARTWQAQAHLSACPLLLLLRKSLPCCLAGWRTSWNCSGLVDGGCWDVCKDFSCASSLKISQSGLWCTELLL